MGEAVPLRHSITEGDPHGGDKETSWTGQLYGQNEQVFARWSEVHWSRQCKQRPSAKSKGQVVLGPEGGAGSLTERSQDSGCKGTGEPWRAFSRKCPSQTCLLNTGWNGVRR